MTDRLNVRRRIGTTASWTVLGLALAFGSVEAMAQDTPAADQTAAEDPVAEEDQDGIIVIGTRASQQSANARKKNARTATDSIVADDIGSFPDRNINEAISRVPGVALSRNEFGEGDSISIRGNGPDLTRVELDGAGVQRSDPSLGTGRGADLRELPAELVKSIDVVKGSTADMTEGGLGGSVQIKTRTGLDFKDTYISLRAGAQQNSLSNDWTPDFNAVFARKFFNDRLGVIISGTYAQVQNSASTYENTTSNQANYARQYDFDNSSEKTFTFNPGTVGTDAADVAFANSLQADGTPLTPRELITLSAGATSKAQCFQLFPNNPNGNGTPGATQAVINSQITQRIREQQTCLNQWNDYLPSFIRNIQQLQDDKRYSIDARFDFRLTDNLTLYVKGTLANRNVNDQLRYRSPISLPNVTGVNTAGSFVDSAPVNGLRSRSVSPNALPGFYLFDPTYSVFPVTTGGVVSPTFGNVLNIDPSSVKVDKNHNVTELTLTNNAVSYDQISNVIDSKSRYAMAGAEWRNGRLFVEAFGAITETEGSRYDFRTSRSSTFGSAKMTVQDNGLWNIENAAFDEYDPANFVQPIAPACVSGGTNPATCIGQVSSAPTAANPAGTTQYLVSQMPLVTPLLQMQYSPRLGETSEKQAKLDITWDTEGLLPLITRVKVGGMYRRNEQYQWTGGGLIVAAAKGTYGQPGYVPAITVPRSTLRGSYRACQPTAGSSAPGGLSCNYGYVASPNPEINREGTYTFTPQELTALFGKIIRPQESEYFGDLPNRGTLPDTWPEMDIDAFFAATGIPNLNFDCVKTCIGSDGKLYDQPFSGADETIKNVYGMVDFEARLPLGLLFNGNAGLRGVFARTTGSGIQRIDVVQRGPAFNPANPTLPAGLITQQFNLPVSLDKSTTDWLPSVNLNLWGFNEQIALRVYGAKTVARPAIGNMVPGGTCTINEVELDAGDDSFGCTGRVGNPGLKPFTAWSYNAALEWYPNADTLLSVAYGRLNVKIGNPEAVTIDTRPFEGSTETDPVTGTPLADLVFNVPTWRNGLGYTRDIWEFNVKHAFTYLPWFFQHFGVDANGSLLASSNSVSGIQDPDTGDVMKPANESRYYINGSLWYDDGKLNVRATVQKRSEQFTCISPCGNNTHSFNYPGVGYTNVAIGTQGYNPGVARFVSESTYIDAKVSYNISRNFQVYLEGRNLGRESQYEFTGPYQRFENGAPKLMRLRYGGRRILGGVRVQFGN